MSTQQVERILIAYGSESGNAERLARQLYESILPQAATLEVTELNQVQLESLRAKDLLLIISSTFGDGEPPGNAEDFALALEQASKVLSFQYAVFGLGDVAYSNFCRCGQIFDKQLGDKGAIRVVNRVDADLDYRTFFSQWAYTLNNVLAGNSSLGHQLDLQVKPYSETAPHQAKVIEVVRLNEGDSGVYSVKLDISGSGMNYRAGDLLYVMPPSQPELLSALARWFDDESAETQLESKELRLLGKSLLRVLAAKSNNKELKNNLKIRNKQNLAEYLYGKDLLDVLQDCGEPGYISLDEIGEVLQNRVPRAYSIASCSASSFNAGSVTEVSLCTRDIVYDLNNRLHCGACSHYLSTRSPDDLVKVFTRSNPEFHLESDINTPVVMIGAGTGIAPYIGFLQQLEHQHSQRETLLFFGERYSEHDFLYKIELREWADKGVLSELITAFSRDQKEKFYVQDALIEQGETVWRALENEAIIYVCGSKANLANAINQALSTIVQKHGGLSLEQAQQYILKLSDDRRYRRDLY